MKKSKKKIKSKVDSWTEEEYESYLCGLYGYGEIIDYTPGGFLIGIPIDMNDEDYEPDKEKDKKVKGTDDELPF